MLTVSAIMDSYKLMGLVEILGKSLKIFFKSGKLMPSIASLTLLLGTLFLLSNSYSIKPLLSDMIIKQIILSSTSPDSPDFAKLVAAIKQDARNLIGIELVFILAYSVVSLFFNTSTILLSAKALCGKKLSLKELLLGIARSWKRFFITSFFTGILGIVFSTLIVLAAIIPIFLICDHPLASVAMAIVVGILALILYLYLSVVWFLALVISVVEGNCYGIEAFGKARELVKGNRLLGFALNFVYMSISSIVIVLPSFGMGMEKQLAGAQTVISLFSNICILLSTMFLFISYTVLYFQCKKAHGEEIELQDGPEYSQLPTKPLAKDIP